MNALDITPDKQLIAAAGKQWLSNLYKSMIYNRPTQPLARGQNVVHDTALRCWQGPLKWENIF